MENKKKNIIIVLLDGARWDRIYQSKEFSNIIKTGTLVNNVTTNIPYTIGAVNTIMSGLYGKDNGVDAYFKMFRLKDSVKILPEVLQENGYFTACDLLSEKIISKRGFNIHQFHDEYKDDLFSRHPDLIKKCLKESGDNPFFLFLHFTKIHKVTVSEVLKKYEWNDSKFYEKQEKNLENYDKVFEESGKYAETINKTLERLKIEDNTVLIFFSDHGTGVGERFGERNYGSFTYEETIRSFYLFLGKEIIHNKKSDSLIENIDIFPTLLDIVGIENNLGKPGKSFKNFLIQQDTILENKSHTFSETGALHGPYPSPKESNVFCIKTPNFKLMYHKAIEEWRFYDLIEDPKEENNIYNSNLPQILQLQEKLKKYIKK